MFEDNNTIEPSNWFAKHPAKNLAEKMLIKTHQSCGLLVYMYHITMRQPPAADLFSGDFSKDLHTVKATTGPGDRRIIHKRIVLQ